MTEDTPIPGSLARVGRSSSAHAHRLADAASDCTSRYAVERSMRRASRLRRIARQLETLAERTCAAVGIPREAASPDPMVVLKKLVDRAEALEAGVRVQHRENAKVVLNAPAPPAPADLRGEGNVEVSIVFRDLDAIAIEELSPEALTAVDTFARGVTGTTVRLRTDLDHLEAAAKAVVDAARRTR